MPRFFLDSDLSAPARVLLSDPHEVHHAKHVLRCRKEDRVTLINGRGEEASGIITRIAKQGLVIDLLTRRYEPAPEGRRQLTLACGLTRGQKIEWIVEKLTELGMHRFIPLVTHRTQAGLSRQKTGSHKTLRLRAAAIAALKQCGGLWLPEIRPLTGWDQLLEDSSRYDTKGIATLASQGLSLRRFLESYPDARELLMLIGPEGDFTSEEVDQAMSKGFHPVSLGRRVLRTETAAVAAAALIMIDGKAPDE